MLNSSPPMGPVRPSAIYHPRGNAPALRCSPPHAFMLTISTTPAVRPMPGPPTFPRTNQHQKRRDTRRDNDPPPCFLSVHPPLTHFPPASFMHISVKDLRRITAAKAPLIGVLRKLTSGVSKDGDRNRPDACVIFRLSIFAV